MIKKCIFIAAAMLAIFITSHSQVRDTINIPDIPGYKTLKYDPHMHTVFSDGLVWPTVRLHEAWLEGLDIISLTDHIEYRPFSKDVVSDFNRSYEIAKPLAGPMGLMLIHGTEITRGMPPGHFNAVFIDDANLMDTEDWRDAMKEAKSQGAFIFWNHPGWARQQPDTTLWWSDHDWLMENGMIHGIEVVNGGEYYPEAHRWCLDKNLTMIGSSDIHNPVAMDYDLMNGQRRPMTLVFVKEESDEGVREALFSGRTAVYFDNKLVGRADYLDAIFRKTLQVKSVTRNRGSYLITLHNPTDIPVNLSKARGNDAAYEFFRSVTVPAGGVSNITVYIDNAEEYDSIELKLVVENFLTEPGKGMPVTLKFAP